MLVDWDARPDDVFVLVFAQRQSVRVGHKVVSALRDDLDAKDELRKKRALDANFLLFGK